MTRHGYARGRGRWIGAVLLATALCCATASAEMAEENEYCLACHSDDTMTLELEDGTEMSLYVDADVFAGSIHGDELFCTDCHDNGYEDEHPTGATFESRRAYAIRSYDLCKKCHFDTYTRTLESVHYQYLKEGLEIAPVCSDCHGAHDIHDPHEKQTMISESCGACHDDVYTVYAGSAHGEALAVDNPDVPGCADCHTAHSIRNPESARFHLASPEICIRCHGDEELMQKYGLATTVASTYLSDFHGVTASLASDEDEPGESPLVVVCVDCHGYHDIEWTDEVDDATWKKKVHAVCSSCHTDASPDFPAAWLSHYPPSLKNAPLVFLVDLFYKIFIPFVVIGLVLQVLLHLYRVAVRR